MESSSASKLSLSLKSEGFEDFTLTPDEPRIIKNCDLEDFSLTPEASVSESPMGAATADDACAELNFHETRQTDSLPRPSIGEHSETLSNNDVLEIVDKFLTNERLLQENLNIIPITRTSASPLISPIDSDASLTNILVAKQTGTLFNSQNSSSKSTLDGTMDLEKFHYDEVYAADADYSGSMENKCTPNATFHLNETNDTKAKCTSSQPKYPIDASRDAHLSSRSASAARIPTRYSMQKLEPYYFADDEADGQKKKDQCKVPTPQKAKPVDQNTKKDTIDNKTKERPDKIEKTDKKDKDEKKQKKEKKGNMNNCGPRDYCAIVETEPATFGKKKFFSLLRRKKSQSLESVSKRSTCYPL